MFGSLDDFRSEHLIFDIVPFRSGYHALLGRTPLAQFNIVPRYAYLKLKMPGPTGVITVNANMECSLQIEEHTAALAAEGQSSAEGTKCQPTIKARDAGKQARALSPPKDPPSVRRT